MDLKYANSNAEKRDKKMKIFFQKTLKGFIPCYNSDKEAYDKLKFNKAYSCEIKLSRNPGHHKLVFAEAQYVISRTDKEFWKTKEPYFLIKAIIRELGYVDEEYHLDGEVTEKAKSISFDNMGEDEFSEIHEKIRPYFAQIGNCTVDDLDQNYAEYL